MEPLLPPIEEKHVEHLAAELGATPDDQERWVNAQMERIRSADVLLWSFLNAWRKKLKDADSDTAKTMIVIGCQVYRLLDLAMQDIAAEGVQEN